MGPVCPGPWAGVMYLVIVSKVRNQPYLVRVPVFSPWPAFVLGVIKLCKDILQKSQVEETFHLRGERCIFMDSSSRALGHRTAPLRSVSDTRCEGLEPKKTGLAQSPCPIFYAIWEPCLMLGTCLRLAWTSYLLSLGWQTPLLVLLLQPQSSRRDYSWEVCMQCGCAYGEAQEHRVCKKSGVCLLWRCYNTNLPARTLWRHSF